MTNVGEAFKWDLLGSAKYVGKLAERYPPRPINKLTPIIKNIHIRDFIVESAEQVLNTDRMPVRSWTWFSVKWIKSFINFLIKKSLHWDLLFQALITVSKAGSLLSPK